MEIVKKKNKKYGLDGVTFQYNCHCGCRFNAIYPTDIYHDDRHPEFRYFLCPNCGWSHEPNIFARLRYLLYSLIH